MAGPADETQSGLVDRLVDHRKLFQGKAVGTFNGMGLGVGQPRRGQLLQQFLAGMEVTARKPDRRWRVTASSSATSSAG